MIWNNQKHRRRLRRPPRWVCGLCFWLSYCKRFAQSAGPGILQLTFFDALEPLWRSCKSAFCDLGGHFWSILESLLHPWGHFWSTLGIFFVSKNRLGCQRSTKWRQPQNKFTLFDIILVSFFNHCRFSGQHPESLRKRVRTIFFGTGTNLEN